jgi:oligogalacturonide transporter
MGIIFAVLFMITAGLLFLFSWERPPEEVAALRPAGEAKPSAAKAFKALYRNLFSTFRIRAFRLHLGMYLGGYISQDIFNAAFTFFIVFALAGSISIASSMIGWLYVVQFVAVGITIAVVLRTPPALAYRFAASTFALGVVVLLLMWNAGVRSGNLLLWVPIVLAGLGRGALNYIPWATYNYMADVDEIVTGRRREGAFAGVMTFIRKLTQAAAVSIVGVVMSLGGFDSKAKVQSPQAIDIIAAVLGIGTLAMLLFGILVSLRFKLDRRTHAALMDEIDRFKSRPDAPTSATTRAIVEDLSGWPHDKLWGCNPVA